MALSASDLLVADNVIAALKIGGSFNWKDAIAAFESGTTEQKIVDGLIAADDVAKIVGVFFPPVAVVANDVGIAISLEQAVDSIVAWLQAQPAVRKAEASAWARVSGTFTSLANLFRSKQS